VRKILPLGEISVQRLGTYIQRLGIYIQRLGTETALRE